jgi:hypothetical protein
MNDRSATHLESKVVESNWAIAQAMQGLVGTLAVLKKYCRHIKSTPFI